MTIALTVSQVVLSLVLTTVILLQQRGTGLGDAFGGGSGSYRSRRGFEQTLHTATVVVAVLFVANAIALLFVR